MPSRKAAQPERKTRVTRTSRKPSKNKVDLENMIAIDLPPRYKFTDNKPLKADKLPMDPITENLIGTISLDKYRRQPDGKIIDNEYNPAQQEEIILQLGDRSTNQIHQHALLQVMKREHRMMDMIIRVKGTDYGCHRTLLYGESPYLRKKLRSLDINFVLVIELNSSDHGGLLGCLDFLYKRACKIDIENVSSLMVAAKELHINRFYKKCIEFIRNSQNQYPMQCFFLAKQFKITRVEREVRKEVRDQKIDIFKINFLYQLSLDKIRDCLQDKGLFRNEESAMKFLIQYFRMHGEQDIIIFKDIMKFICWPKLRGNKVDSYFEGRYKDIIVAFQKGEDF
ncbi:hypothetical protein ACOME3_009096 [Neoechinorhynchus agilis]